MKTIEADGKRKTFANRFSGNETKQMRRESEMSATEEEADVDECAGIELHVIVVVVVRLRDRG